MTNNYLVFHLLYVLILLCMLCLGLLVVVDLICWLCFLPLLCIKNSLWKLKLNLLFNIMLAFQSDNRTIMYFCSCQWGTVLLGDQSWDMCNYPQREWTLNCCMMPPEGKLVVAEERAIWALKCCVIVFAMSSLFPVHEDVSN